MSKESIDSLLAAIEHQELRSLVWGHVDGSISASEALQLAGEHAEDANPQQLLDDLVDRALVFEVAWDADGMRYRSRFAETTRLLVRLRQITYWNTWDVAPQLVADYRVDARPRLYAPRDVSIDAAIAIMRETHRWDPFRESLLRQIDTAGDLQLSTFQVDAARAVHDWHDGHQGIVITAGTGSGKTLAYYLPVMVETAALARQGEHWVKSVSIYPRVELLKDQFSEVVRLACGPGFSRESNRRPLRLGALFGGTPKDADALDHVSASANIWPATGAGRRCLFLRCPTQGCDGDVVWLDADRRERRELLHCTACGWMHGGDGELALTRESMQAQPPDLLFTTAEMVNQRMSDPRMRAVFGITPRKEFRARFLLLDEIHTYGGVIGAQIGSVVRRWRHAVGRPVLVTGLSATLKDAPDFLADLTGIRPQHIQEISPREDDLAETSMSYQLILRADATSRTAVLSTTIQSAFLLARMLDQGDITTGRKSDGRFGSRLFVFTDTLDVANRLFDNLRDAERGAKGQPLATYREPSKQDDRVKRAEGQSWGSAEVLQGSLARKLRVSRTSSQDSGVDARSEIVVATASLEVGYNDPRVGAVIQHRAPYDHATFLQRRGRAGRSLAMRPWMVTILSEYGRDRSAFQMYERLMEPVLESLRLPIGNRYVQRIQATHAFLDWLGLQMPHRGWMWAVVDGPKETRWRAGQNEILALLDRVLAGDEVLIKSLRDHVKGAVQLSDDDTDAVMWTPPRSILLEALPTLRRRLATNWTIAGRGHDIAQRWHPLPDFLPAALFSDLSLPEVAIAVPDVPEEYSQGLMPVGQMLREFSPGRVTRRFAVKDRRPFDPQRGQLSHWIPPGDPATPAIEGESASAAESIIDLDDWMRQGDQVGYVDWDGPPFACYRPSEVQLTTTPQDVAPTSHGALDWQVRFDPTGDPVGLTVPTGAGASAIFGVLDLYIHSRRTPVTVFRFALGGEASIRNLRSREEHRFRYRFAKGRNARAGLGFALEADAIRVSVQVPGTDELNHIVASESTAGQLSEYFRHLLASDTAVIANANRFEIEWLGDALLLAVARVASSERLSRAEAVDEVKRDVYGSARESFDLMLAAGMGVPEEEAEATLQGEAAYGQRTKLADDLRALLQKNELLASLEHHLTELASPDQGRYAAWLRSQFIEGAAGALLAACIEFLPDQAGADILVMDIVDGPEPEIWITETILGGGGAIEAIGTAFAEDPWRFARAFEAALAESDAEIVAGALHRTLTLMLQSPKVATAATAIRKATTHGERSRAQINFNRLLASHGIPIDRSIAVAISQRLMRLGADSGFDAMLADADRARIEIEALLGFALDLRLMTLVLASAPGLDDKLLAGFTRLRGERPTAPQVAATLAGILWPSLAEVRRHVLEVYSPFRPASHPDPKPLRSVVATSVPRVRLGDPAAVDAATLALGTQGVVELVQEEGNSDLLVGAAHDLLSTPITLEFLRLYPSIAGIRGEGDSLVARLEVRELA